MMKLVLPFKSACRPSCKRRSVFASMEDVASSSTRIFGSDSSVLANAISCFWPYERREPRSFTCV